MRILLLVLATLSAGCNVFLPNKGEEGQPCLGGEVCAPGLVCFQGTCQAHPGDGGTDGGSDPGTDAGLDAGDNEAFDAGTDAGDDEELDASTDAGTDAGSDPGADPGEDLTAPAPVNDLSAEAESATSVTLSWTAPGDDGLEGTASSYDIRFSLNYITEGNFTACPQTDSSPGPSVSGGTDWITITGLEQGLTYYFALKTSDEADNFSPLSNIATATPGSTDVTPPGQIIDLSIAGFTVTTVTLSWTATGDDGQTGQATAYDLRYSTSQIVDQSDFDSATRVSGLTAPLPPGTPQGFTVNQLQERETYYFCIRIADEVPNWSGLSNKVSIEMVECTTDIDCLDDPEGQNHCKTSPTPSVPQQYTCVGCTQDDQCEEGFYVCSDTDFVCEKKPCFDYSNPNEQCQTIDPCYYCDTQSGHCRPAFACTYPDGTECCQGHTCSMMSNCVRNNECSGDGDCPPQMVCNVDRCEIPSCCSPICEPNEYCDSECLCQPGCKGEGDPCGQSGDNDCCSVMFCPVTIPFCTRY